MTEFEEYKQTGMLGSYFAENAKLYKSENGNVGTLLRDTAYWERDGCAVHERKMYIEGSAYKIISVFPDAPTATPTEKLLSLIDAELEKENRGA